MPCCVIYDAKCLVEHDMFNLGFQIVLLMQDWFADYIIISGFDSS